MSRISQLDELLNPAAVDLVEISHYTGVADPDTGSLYESYFMTLETLYNSIAGIESHNYNFDITTGSYDTQLLPAGTAIIGVNFYDETGTIEDPINIRIGTTLNGEQILADVPITPGDAKGQRLNLCYSNSEAVTVYIGISESGSGLPVHVCLETKKIY